uniref:Uncharacterized protein n=1 Tax=Romanomermis culicivorax TaxID=13658 RepID=A0A915IBW9_ROMCU
MKSRHIKNNSKGPTILRRTVPYGTTLSCYASPHAQRGAVRHLMSGCYTSRRTFHLKSIFFQLNKPVETAINDHDWIKFFNLETNKSVITERACNNQNNPATVQVDVKMARPSYVVLIYDRQTLYKIRYSLAHPKNPLHMESRITHGSGATGYRFVITEIAIAKGYAAQIPKAPKITSTKRCDVRTLPPTTAACGDGFRMELCGRIIVTGLRQPYKENLGAQRRLILNKKLI